MKTAAAAIVLLAYAAYGRYFSFADKSPQSCESSNNGIVQFRLQEHDEHIDREEASLLQVKNHNQKRNGHQSELPKDQASNEKQAPLSFIQATSSASDRREWRQPYSLPVHDDSEFKIRHVVPPEDHVDLVITWHCEDLNWIKDISPEFAPILTVVLLHKLDKEEEQTPGVNCMAPLPKTPFNMSLVRLRNRGRDTHSPFLFIKNNYRTLAGYTMFMQAQQHWILQWSPPIMSPARSFHSNADAVNDFILMSQRRHAPFIPLMPYAKDDDSPMLYADRESDIDREMQDKMIRQTSKYLFTFDAGPRNCGGCTSDMANQARELYSILFGKSACDTPRSSPVLGPTYAPGFQFMVSRDAIWKQPVRMWAGLVDLTLGCQDIGYSIERLSLQLFDSDNKIVDPEHWKKFSVCDRSKPFRDLSSVWKSAEYWRQEWSCEPLSDFLLSRQDSNDGQR